MQDTGHVLFDNHGCGPDRRKELDGSIGNTRSFKSASEEMWGSLNVTLAEGIESLKKNLVIDKDFKPFFQFTQEYNIPFTVISAGLKPLLSAALEEFLGHRDASKIAIISNEGEISQDGSSWKAIWRHPDTELGHDKARSVNEFRESVIGVQPLVVFIGDGVSDLAAASKADVLFARRGLKLEEYCIEHRIPYIPYDSFADIQKDLESLVEGNVYHDESASVVPSLASSKSNSTNSILSVFDNVPKTTTPLTPLPSYFPEMPLNKPGRPSSYRSISQQSIGSVAAFN